MSSPARWLSRPLVVRVAQVAIGAVFLVAAAGKISDPPYFAQQVHNYRLAPIWSENLVAITLPWVELLAGAALVTGFRRRAGAVIALALMLAFTAGVAIAWSRGLDFRCGCFGKGDATRIGASKFAENVAVSLIALLATLRPRSD